MCLLMTAAAALICALVFCLKDRDNRLKTGTLALIYLAAALMWCVAGSAARLYGEDFFNLSSDDALLGGVVIAGGLAVYLVLLLLSGLRRMGAGRI